ncbi:DNA polymerase [Methanomethylophilus alvi]|uniref:DNA polymerase n=1 Tax=Methanomethylophilus alvi TaxID=1291540 RepID=UPI0037DD0426
MADVDDFIDRAIREEDWVGLSHIVSDIVTDEELFMDYGCSAGYLDDLATNMIGREDDSTFGFEQEWWEDVLMRRSYTADFETTTDPNDCRVWAVATCEIDDSCNNIERGTSVEWFMDWCKRHAQCNVYFHNLAFDGAFIMDWLERNGWLWVPDRKSVCDHSYTTVISDANQVYCIELYFTPVFHVKILDSLKIIPLSVAAMAKAYNLPILKGSIDYTAHREVGHELTDEEIAYIDNDVRIVAMAMSHFLSEGLNKMTAGSNALSDYRSGMGGKKGFRRWFPALSDEEDEFIRGAYRGGFTYVAPRYQGKRLGEGIVFDVNSLYPSVMYGCSGERLPYGIPERFEGAPKPTEAFDLWVAQVTCSFRLRENHIPCIQLKGNFRFSQTEYLERSDGEVTFTVTSVDWDLIMQQYHVYDVRWHGGYLFRSANFLFREYIDHWVGVKNQATIDGNGGMRQIAKLMLNSLYGKFATRTTVYSRRPMLVNDVLRYVDLPPTHRDPVYLPVGVFVTAWARYKTIRAAQSVYDRFVYADTDSIHLLGTEVPDGLDVDDVRLGAWKHESTFHKAKFLRAKCYVEYEIDSDKPTVHVAGMPSNVHSEVNIDNFQVGAEYFGKLYTHRVRGGIVLVPGDMQIRE